MRRKAEAQTHVLKMTEQNHGSPWCVSHSVVSDSLWPHGLEPARLFCPWDSPDKDTGVGCHSLLQGIFLMQGSNLGLLPCRQLLYHLSHQGSPPAPGAWGYTWSTELTNHRAAYCRLKCVFPKFIRWSLNPRCLEIRLYWQILPIIKEVIIVKRNLMGGP